MNLLSYYIISCFHNTWFVKSHINKNSNLEANFINPNVLTTILKTKGFYFDGV